jgi:allophanate hydrolase subunit 1
MEKNAMKKITFSFFILLIMSALAFASSKEINEFFKAIESLTVKYEALAKQSSVTIDELQKLSKDIEELKISEKAEKIATLKEWTQEDAERWIKLTERISIASNTVMSKLKY